MRTLLFGDSITGYIPKQLLNADWYYNLKRNIDNKNDNFDYYKCATENYTTQMLRDYVFKKIDVSFYDIIVLQCGINDFLRPRYDEDCKEKTPKEIYQGIVEFANEIKRISNARLIIQSIYPIKGEKIENITLNIQSINQALEKYCYDNCIEFWDIYSLLADESGEMDDRYSDDGLHPNEEGYKIVCNFINSNINNKPKVTNKRR